MSKPDQTTINGIEIDEAKAKALLNWLVLTERRNVKSKEKSDPQMITIIQKKIEEVVQCY